MTLHTFDYGIKPTISDKNLDLILTSGDIIVMSFSWKKSANFQQTNNYGHLSAWRCGSFDLRCIAFECVNAG